MVMYPIHIAFSGYALIGLALLILAGSTAVYLLRLPSKSPATRSLIGFFVLVSLSGLATILVNGLFYWNRMFNPWQDFWILAGGIALAQLAYRIPAQEDSREAKLVISIMSGFALIGLVYCFFFDYRFLFQWTPGFNVSDAFYLLLPIETLLIVVVFLRRAIIVSKRAESDKDSSERSTWGHLIHPQSEASKTLRNLALALSLAFLPGLQILLNFPGIAGFILSNIGSLLAITTISLVYFNYAPEVNSFMGKLVGITLVTVVLIFSVFGSINVYLAEIDYGKDLRQAAGSIQDSLVSSRAIFFTPPQAVYIVSWESAHPNAAGTYQLLFHREGEDRFDLDRLIAENLQGYLKTWSQPKAGSLGTLISENLRSIQRYWTYPLGSGQADYQSYIFTSHGRTYEIGFSKAAKDDYLSAIVSQWMLVTLLSSALVLLVFPLFFRRILVKPLENLLGGVRRANEGELDIVIPPSFNDEIGYLTQSFNRMLSSVYQARFSLQERALEMERQISQRTIDLVNTNVKLEKENKSREIAERLLSRQLLYQKALAGCSHSLLVAREPENENDQRTILEQALDHLCSGAGASRAYIFHAFDDPELGPCIGMIAEICAFGIPAQIGTPENRRYPLSRLQTDFMSVLANGNPFGGPVRSAFASTPSLLETFLNQRPPLLSMILFPLLIRDQLWGFIGFDDCISEREWDQQEISMLGTASEMIGNTLQRWEIAGHLRETLDKLEVRVQERTHELSRSNTQLTEEIEQRLLTQKDLETRLKIEELLAHISTRLLEPTAIRENILASLEDLGHIMDACRIFVVELGQQDTDQVKDFLQWHKSEVSPVSTEILQGLIGPFGVFGDALSRGETVYVEDISQTELIRDVDARTLRALSIQSLVLAPLTLAHRIHGVLGCSNLQGSSEIVKRNMDILGLVAGMITNLLQREYLIQMLEEQVAERTRQLTTFMDVAMISDRTNDLVDLLQPALLSIIQIAACDATAIHIMNEERSSLDLVAQRGIPHKSLQSFQMIEMETEFAAWMNQPLPATDAGSFGPPTPFPEPFCVRGFRVFYGTRLKTANKSLGLLSCYRIEDKPLSHFQESLLTALGELLGVVVENHRLRIEAEELATIAERQRLAREIHDAVSQSVYSLSLFARSAQDAQVAGNEIKLLSNLHDLELTAMQAMREMRLLLYQLRDTGQEENITSALNTRFKQVENRLGIDATCDIETDLHLSVSIRHEVWRILIEALNNVVKHAGASKVHVQVLSREGHLWVAVQDNGVGLDVNEPSPGMGLKNIRTRAENLGGTLEVISDLGLGTRIIVRIPI